MHGSRQTYTVLLVVATQRLALYGILLRRQTLTATHDESTAWVGLGSALLVLWKQTHIAASVVGTSLITIYLVGISVLHISTPSLFNLQVFDQPNSTMISTRIGMPEIYFSFLLTISLAQGIKIHSLLGGYNTFLVVSCLC
jgi:hypothetical protein